MDGRPRERPRLAECRILRHGLAPTRDGRARPPPDPGRPLCVPDVYPGTEIWDLSLVDPDNRRLVDFALRARLLRKLLGEEEDGREAFLRRLLTRWRAGGINFHVTHRTLRFRREHSSLFAEGEYLPVRASGHRSGQVCAFARAMDETWVVAAVPRFSRALAEPGEPPLGPRSWGITSLLRPRRAPACLHNGRTGEALLASPAAARTAALRLSRVYRSFPVALLHGATPGQGSRALP